MKGQDVRGHCRHGWGEAGAGGLRLLQPTLAAHEVAPHRHDEAHVVLVLRGRYEHPQGLSDGRPLLVFNPPRTEHQDRFAAGESLPGLRFLVLSVSSARWWQWQQLADLPQRVQVLGGPAVLPLIGRWMQHLRAGPESLDDVLADTLHVVKAPCDAVPCRAWLRRARAHLRQCVMDGAGLPRLGELAQSLGVHPVTLARAFQRHFGCSPTAYVHRLRMDRALALLAQGAPVADVGAACGYFDQAHFSRQFKAAMRVPPGHWQRG